LKEHQCAFSKIGAQFLQACGYINPKAYGVIIILVEGEPRDAMFALGNPVTQQRGLAEPGGRGDECQGSRDIQLFD
jgi:hypothetical protein